MTEKKRSTTAGITEKLISLGTIDKGAILTEVILEYRKHKGDKKKYSLPLFMKMSKSLKEQTFDKMQIFYLNEEENTDYTIIYLHGGAYVNEMMVFHWMMLENISSKLQSYIIVPDYGLAPLHDFKEAYRDLTDLYVQYRQKHPHKKIVLMGDSAGGGLAIGLAQYWHANNIEQPYKIISLSPWLDLTMTNPDIEKYIHVDPMLKVDELKVDSQYWANGTDLHDYRLSPIYGNIQGLHDIYLFVGTHEIFYPDVTKFYNRLKDNHIKTELFIGEGLNHVYPAFPIPEAKQALDTIVQIIKDEK
ncbi:MAG: alpha/beta hydrolase [Erysipelotrichia bacterium]|nr:alpha/beta hydrolase [Erysipelotrichia bacterium]